MNVSKKTPPADIDETDAGTNPLDACLPDVEADACDQDDDGLTNAEEEDLGTDPMDEDSDDDGVEEVTVSNDEKIAALEKQIEAKKAAMEGASWADAADIEDEIDDLEEELATLRAH
mgnify:CR=1 FL=1